MDFSQWLRHISSPPHRSSDRLSRVSDSLHSLLQSSVSFAPRSAAPLASGNILKGLVSGSMTVPKTPKNLALVSRTPTCLSHKGETQIKEQLHWAFKTGMSLLSFPGPKIHSVHWYSKWSFSASQAFWLNIALYGPTPVPTVLPFLLMVIHTRSLVHNVILIPSIFKTFDLNVSNYPGR